MSHQMDSKNCCHGRSSFRGFGKNLFNGMMNRFESRRFIAIIGEVDRLVLKETSHLYFTAAEQIFPHIAKKNKKSDMVLQDALSAVDAGKQFYKII